MNGTENKDVTNRRKWDQQDDNERDESEEILDGSTDRKGETQNRLVGRSFMKQFPTLSFLTYRRLRTSLGFNV